MQAVSQTEELLLQVLHEDADLLVVNKPAGLVCHPTKDGPASSLIGRVRMYLAAQTNATFHLINRLDRETSGVVLVAKNAVAAGEFGKIWEQRLVEKEYLAIVHGSVKDETGLIAAPLGKDLRSPVAIKDCVRPDGASATTEYTVQRRFARDGRAFSLLKCRPLTGRKHQIRIHLAHLGHPIVGDKIYGGDERIYLLFVSRQLAPEQQQELLLPYHALHAASLSFAWRGRPCQFHAEPEPWFAQFLASAIQSPDSFDLELRNSGKDLLFSS